MSHEIVTLNVGGTLYTTTRSTLITYPDSMLGAMFKETVPLENSKDDQGNYFIDRDGQLFQYILIFLRLSKLVLPKNFQEIEEFQMEVDFYQIPPLIEAFQEYLNASNSGSRDNSESSVIDVNVGGILYTTTRDTLIKYSNGFGDHCSRLYDMFIDPPIEACLKDKQGNYFIDRDGSLFKYILNYLRTGELDIPANFKETPALQREAEYYRIFPVGTMIWNQY